MKITFVHLNRYKEIGSTDFYELTQAVGARLPGRVDVIVARNGASQIDIAGPVRLHEVAVKTLHVWTRESVCFFREAAKEIISLRPDVAIVTFDRGAFLIPLLVRHSLGTHSPSFLHHVCSVSFVSQQWRYRAGNLLTKMESSFFDAVTTLSWDIATEIYGEHYRKPIEIIPIGVNMSRFRFDATAREKLRHRMNVSEEQTVFIYAGTICALKNCDDLIPAFQQSRSFKAGAQLWILGDGELRAHLEQQARASGLAESVRILGRVPFQEMAAYLSAADAAISHATRNSRSYIQPPIKVLEYLASSTTVFASDIPGNRFYLQEARGCYFYPPTLSGLAQAMHWGVSNPTLLRKARAETREIAKRFDWEKIASVLIEKVMLIPARTSG
jgi:glycosyltransferase involved in cell wall biosynthesis